MRSYVLSKFCLLILCGLVFCPAWSFLSAAPVPGFPPYADVRAVLMEKVLEGDRASQLQAKTDLVSYLREDATREEVEQDIAEMIARVKLDRSISQLRGKGSPSGITSKRRHDLAELLIENGHRFELLVMTVEEESLFDLTPLLIENIHISSTLGIDTYPIEVHYPAYAALKRMRVDASPVLDRIENSTGTQHALLTQLLVDRLGRTEARIAVLERLRTHEKLGPSSPEITATKKHLQDSLVQIGGVQTEASPHNVTNDTGEGSVSD